MFTVELKINGALIGHIHGVNKGIGQEGATTYDYDYYDVEKGDLSKGRIFHKREDGINHLIKLILEDLEENE